MNELPKLSVVLPIYNEEKNIPLLFEKLVPVLESQGSWEIIAVDDGSQDDSMLALRESAQTNANIKVINLARNFGQTAALNAGIKHAIGEVIILIDSDLENDPADIPKLLDKLDEGYDVVSGWRQDRWKGEFLTRKLPSRMANALISGISGIHLHDYGCTLKAYRREVIQDVILYGEMHRFIPIYCSWQGGKIAEVPVNYHPRIHGQSSYGIARTLHVVLDLFLIKFMGNYMSRPIHFFGGFGLLSLLAGFTSALVAVAYKVIGLKDFVETPLPVMTAFFIMTGLMFILLGILAEIQIRVYYESRGVLPCRIAEKINLPEEAG